MHSYAAQYLTEINKYMRGFMFKRVFTIAIFTALTSCSSPRKQITEIIEVKPSVAVVEINKKEVKERLESCKPIQDERYFAKARVNIKGYYLGMDKCEIITKFGIPNESLTIVDFNVGDPMLEFIDDKLSMFFSRFPESKFDLTREAYFEKYPEMKCINSLVQNGYGTKYEQITCSVSSEIGRLVLTRFTGDVRNSTIVLMANKLIEKNIDSEIKKKKDI